MWPRGSLRLCLASSACEGRQSLVRLRFLADCRPTVHVAFSSLMRIGIFALHISDDLLATRASSRFWGLMPLTSTPYHYAGAPVTPHAAVAWRSRIPGSPVGSSPMRTPEQLFMSNDDDLTRHAVIPSSHATRATQCRLLSLRALW